MHVAGKVFLGLGVLLLLFGIVVSGSGIGSVKDAANSVDLGDFAIENSNSGTVNVTDEDGKGDLGFTFWIKGEYLDEDGDGEWDHCAATNITILSHPEISDDEFWGEARELNGSFYYEANDSYRGCEADEGNKNLDREGEGLIKVGRACLACYAGPMEFESNAEVSVTNDDYLLGMFIEGFLEGAGGIMGIVGGVGLSGCGFCFLFLGGLLAFVVPDPKEATQMQQLPSVYSKD